MNRRILTAMHTEIYIFIYLCNIYIYIYMFARMQPYTFSHMFSNPRFVHLQIQKLKLDIET